MVVVLLGCGGTISMREKGDGGFKPEVFIEDLLKQIPELEGFSELETKRIMQVDSSNLQPEDWLTITEAINSNINRPEVEGVVVVHGTDTLTYSASAAGLMIQNLPKPVVFTGSQIPLARVGSDGRRNLIDSIRVAKEVDIAESIIVFNNKIYRSVRTLKLREYEIAAFDSVDSPPIGDISLNINILEQIYRKRNEKLKTNFLPYLDSKVAMIKLFPGLDPGTLEKLIIDGEYHGLVLEAYGAGNIPIKNRSLLTLIANLCELNIPTVITTQCIWGRTEMMLYESGRKAYRAGAIPGFDMTSPTALLKLMWILGQYHGKISLNEIEQKMHTNYVGEINPKISPREDIS
jgi:L-asparaginase